MGDLKNNSRIVDDAKFQGVKRPCELIYCTLGIEKSDLDEVVLSSAMALKIHNLPSERVTNQLC
jgi:hypothetical protein